MSSSSDYTALPMFDKPERDWCRHCNRERHNHAASLQCLFDITHFEEMTFTQYASLHCWQMQYHQPIGVTAPQPHNWILLTVVI